MVYLLCMYAGSFSARLVAANKTSPYLTAGRVEYYFSGRWGSVCIDGYSRLDAVSQCRALTGSSTVLRYGRVGRSYYSGIG